MITTTEIAPSPVLSPFVRCYRHREFDTKGLVMINPWHASHEICLTFHFKDLPTGSINPYTGQVLKAGNYGGVLGLGTQYNGEITLNGCYSFLEIVFKPHGFQAIFRILSKDVNNLIVFADDIFDSDIKLFYEQLCGACTLPEMGMLANAYLQQHLKKQKSVNCNEAVAVSSNMILKHAGKVPIERLAYDVNMSMRNFERRFVEQVGVSPKLMCCITRFNNALSLKLKKPWKSWMTIVHESGYFDQMHLIRDFKRFSGTTPPSFLEQTPMSQETYTSRVGI